jgi:16S rRNA (guanine527-N7)-methyltransferase
VAATIALRIQRRLLRAGVELGSDQVDQLAAYFCLLAKWNAKISLTSLQLEPASDEAVDRLLVEPVLAASRMEIAARPADGTVSAGAKLIDLGSGGGSPGFPIKISAPSLRTTLVESKTRKCAFLREVVRALNLPGVDVVAARFEELLTRPDFHEAADFLSLRAVRADGRLWRTIQAFLKPGGQVIWFASAQQGKRDVPPPFAIESSEILLPSTGSHLIRLRKLGHA